MERDVDVHVTHNFLSMTRFINPCTSALSHVIVIKKKSGSKIFLTYAQSSSSLVMSVFIDFDSSCYVKLTSNTVCLLPQ